MFKHHTHCRACNFAFSAPGTKCQPNDRLIPVLDLGVQPLANDFRREDETCEGHYPLKVMLCPRCKLAQLSVVVDPKTLYSNYAYVTSHSQTMMRHFDELRNDIMVETTVANSVLEIGSNDGTFLAFLKNNPFETVLGCDPAENLAKIANGRGIPTFCGLFTVENCDCQKAKDVVIARHVMCHIDDWTDFMVSLERVTHDESLVVIEVPYYKDMINRNSWDQVYAEHLSYMSIGAMEALCARSSFHIHTIKKYGIHGGSVVFFLRKNGSVVKPVPYAKDEDQALGEWQMLSDNKEDMVLELKSLVADLRTQGKRVAAYGASAKSTVWLNACGFTAKEISYICDNTPQKQYTFSPGSNIPVLCEGMLTADLPDCCICFAWNFFQEIQAKEVIFNKTGKWIVPVPSVKVM